jgi:hypothetical protein
VPQGQGICEPRKGIFYRRQGVFEPRSESLAGVGKGGCGVAIRRIACPPSPTLHSSTFCLSNLSMANETSTADINRGLPQRLRCYFGDRERHVNRIE